MKLPRLARVCALVVFAAGCGSARYVTKTPTGGTLLLEGDRDRAMSQAQRMMVTHCAGDYTIVKPGELVVGGTEAERLQTTKMSYVCRSAPPKPAPPPAAKADAGESPPAAD